MLYLYGDESNTPGADQVWSIGMLFCANPTVHMRAIATIRKETSYEFRELKYSSTDYSQILCAIRLIDYFLDADDLFFKIIIKDDLYFNPLYFQDNYYHLDHKDLSYVSSYAELAKSIKPRLFHQTKKLLNIDDKGFRGNVVLPRFLKEKDPTITQVFRRDSRKRGKSDHFTGVSHMIQLADFLTGVILSIADTTTHRSAQSAKHKNIYRKTLLSKCRGMQVKLSRKQNYYYPSFAYQKINVFYWKQKNASLSKSPGRSRR